MEYYVFAQNNKNQEKLVASSPSLQMARKTALRIANTELVDGVSGASVCAQEGGEVKEIELYRRGTEDPEIFPKD